MHSFLVLQEQYGIDWDGPVTVDEDTESVVIPPTDNPLSSTLYDSLRQAVDPLDECEDHGVQLYEVTRIFVDNHVSH